MKSLLDKISKNFVRVILPVFSLIALGIGVTYFLPKIKAGLAQKKDLQLQVTALQEENDLLDSYLSQRGMLEAQKADFVKALPESIDIAVEMGKFLKVATSSSVLTKVLQYAASNPTTPTTPTTSPSSKSTPVIPIPPTEVPRVSVSQDFIFSGTGAMENVLSLLENFESFSGVLGIENLRVSLPGSSESLSFPSGYEVAFMIKAYHLPKASEAEVTSKDSWQIDVNDPSYQKSLVAAKSLRVWEP